MAFVFYLFILFYFVSKHLKFCGIIHSTKWNTNLSTYNNLCFLFLWLFFAIFLKISSVIGPRALVCLSDLAEWGGGGTDLPHDSDS